MPSRLKKTIASFLLFLVSLSVLSSALPSPAYAQEIQVTNTICNIFTNLDAGPWYEPNPCEFHNKVFNSTDSEIFGERYTYAQVSWITSSLFWLGINTIIHIFNSFVHVIPGAGGVEFTDSSQPSLSPLAQNIVPASIPSEIMTHSSTANLPQALINVYSTQPVSGVKSVLQTLDKFSLASVAHAQGYGYSTLSGIQSLWAASRNLAYLLMVILLIAAGFMIMFRVKISPQAAVSLQVMIPKIIITLIAITFSYAIAGFIIDLVYLLLGIIIFTLHYTSLPDDGHSLIPNPAGSLYFFSSPHLFLIFLAVFVKSLEVVFTATNGNVLASMVFGFIIFIIFTFLVFRVFSMLVKAYLWLIFQIITGPWIILMGLLPSSGPSSVGFGAWVKSVAGSATTFLVVPVMLIFVLTFWAGQPSTDILVQIINAVNIAVTGPAAALMGGIDGINNVASLPALPLFAMSGGILQLFLGYAILSLIPKMADIVRDAFKQPAFKYGTAFGEALGPITGFVGGAMANEGANISKAAKGLTGTAVGTVLQNVGGAIKKGP